VSAAAQGPAAAAPSAWTPLRRALFRSIWIASLASNVGTWMQNVGAAWLMTSLAPTPLFVSLVQAASNLPFFLLALPAGALADVFDRRRIVLAAQLWLFASAAALGALALAGAVDPAALLWLTFAIGAGSAVTAPAFAAIVPELVSHDEIAPAVSLNGISMNLARAVGPALGGLVVGASGAGATFLLNAASFLAVFAALKRWKRPPREGPLPPEDLLGAMRAGLRYVRHSAMLRTVIARTGAFVLPASVLWALLPLYAKAELGLGAAGYGLLLGCFGVGAVLAGVLLPAARGKLGVERLATGAALAFAIASAGLGAIPDLAPPAAVIAAACAALFLAGGAWLSLLSTLSAAAQVAVPSWVRARASAAYLLVLFGALAAGSALFGALASGFGVPHSFEIAAVAIAVGRVATGRRRLEDGDGPDLTPAPRWPDPELVAAVEAQRGPVLVTVEYEIDPADAEPFARAMRALREIRLRDGALRWGLWADAAQPGRHLESFVVESWVEHLRQHERATAADRALQALAIAYHRGAGPPRVTHFVHERMPL
jgi:MFS family permease